jgi:hypothetical protein
MDQSENYVKMCEKAEQITENWKPTGGDWYIHDYRGTTKTSREFERQVWGDSDKRWRAVEILCYQPSESNDTIISTTGKESRCVSVAELTREHCVWLPRQDQLQEMIGGSPYNNVKNSMFSILDDLHRFAFTPNIFNDFIPLTMEQLWLAFVMKEKYSKVWNGTDWVTK